MIIFVKNTILQNKIKCISLSFPCDLGPAGTGKTESVKALGHQLGRFVLVFNCDETFDFQVSDTIQFVFYIIYFPLFFYLSFN